MFGQDASEFSSSDFPAKPIPLGDLDAGAIE
jgi:hypothetical protein